MRAFNFNHILKPNIDFNVNALLHQPLDLEIGAGQGLHAIQYCQANPERTLLAVESTHVRFASLERRRQSHPLLENLHVFHADAVAFASHYLPSPSLDRVFLLYPNPYPKSKQANLRWHNRPFMTLLVEKMQSQAELVLATNIASYAEDAARAMVETWGLQLTSSQKVDRSSPPRTHFEKKYLERGETCWNLVFHKS